MVLVEVDHGHIGPLDGTNIEGSRLPPVERDRLLVSRQVVVGPVDIARVLRRALLKRSR